MCYLTSFSVAYCKIKILRLILRLSSKDDIRGIYIIFH